MSITMNPPKNPSTHIRSLGHDPETNTLAVEFIGGGLYRYYGVDRGTFSELHEHESPGQFLRNRIRNRFHYEKR